MLEKELADALLTVRDHLAAVMTGPMAQAFGVKLLNGVEGIPTIKKADEALAKYYAGRS